MRAFLSHSSADKPLAIKIYRSLRDQAVAVWFDRIEMRPGDSLLKKIAEGISDSDYLLVLVTEISKRSPWVEKEVTIALTQEIQGTGPKVIPLLLEGCDIPTILADKYYVSIDQKGTGVEEVIPAIFRDSYILDIDLKPDDLTCDDRNLQEELYEYTRTEFGDLRVRINNRHFNQKVIEIVDKVSALPGTPEPVINQIKRISGSFNIELPIYWVNLSALLGHLMNQIFSHYGRNLDAVKVARKSVTRSLQFAQYEMCAHIRGAVFGIHAEQFGYADIAAYIRRFERVERHEGEKLTREICQITSGYDLAYAGIEGNRDRRVVDSKIYLPISSGDDRLILQVTCSPDEIIAHETWYGCCLPQILAHFLQWTAFRDGKPLQELEYTMGFSLDDYSRIGFA